MNHQRVLVLDDHEAILEIVTEALRYEQFEVLAIRQGNQFLDAVADFAPDLILLDYILADSNGADLCRQLKSIPEYAWIPVIISSAYIDRRQQENPGGCDGILFKPFDLESLLGMVHLHISSARKPVNAE